MVKSQVRRDYSQKRLDLQPQEIAAYTAAIKSLFENFGLPAIQLLLSYYPVTDRKEFNVGVCEQVLFQKFPLVRIAWPKTDPDTLAMEAHVLDEHGLFAKNKYDILEPIGNNILAPDLIDMVFVPLLAYDTKGFRVGYGKGYYDRYLMRCRNDVIKMGFSFFEPVDTIEDINEFDVPLDYCITPSRLYEF